MKTRAGILFAVVSVSTASLAEELQLPPQVTPALRAACEADVRRFCVGQNPTYAKVKSCVLANFTSFGKRCQVQIALAGIGR